MSYTGQCSEILNQCVEQIEKIRAIHKEDMDALRNQLDDLVIASEGLLELLCSGEDADVTRDAVLLTMNNLIRTIARIKGEPA